MYPHNINLWRTEKMSNEPLLDKTNDSNIVSSEDSDQPGYMPSLIFLKPLTTLE